MDLMNQIIARAQGNKQRIVLAEGTEERTMRAADKLIADGVAEIILIGNPAEITAFAEANGLEHLPKATMVDPINNEKKDVYANLLFELRKSKGMTIEQAQKLAENPLFLACLMIKNGDADGEVAGAANTTGDVLRPAFQIVKTAPGISVVSGAFLMFMPDKSFGDNGVMVFADCAVLPNPNAQELAQIAVSTARTTRAIAGIEPRVAMLSFSTKGSAKHEMVDKVVE
ncbi:MAG: phosphate acyltransferase, partial [Bacteroidales bacterium]